MYSSDLYLEEINKKSWICQNYHAVFEPKNGHNRIIAFEFRIRWGKGE